MPVHNDFVAKNAPYVATFGEKAALPLKPGKKLAIGKFISKIRIDLLDSPTISSDLHGCTYQVGSRHSMLSDEVDQFVSVYAELGINEGDAHIIRNAGGSA